MKFEVNLIRNRLILETRKEVSSLIDHLLLKGLISFPSAKSWWENGVWNEHYKTGDEFAAIITTAVNRKLEEFIQDLEQKYRIKNEDEYTTPDSQ